MITGKKYSIPPAGMVLKGSLQLGNMWRSDHLSRKRTPAGFARAEKCARRHNISLLHLLSLWQWARRRDSVIMRDWLDFEGVYPLCCLVHNAKNLAVIDRTTGVTFTTLHETWNVVEVHWLDGETNVRLMLKWAIHCVEGFDFELEIHIWNTYTKEHNFSNTWINLN